ncbi:MAG: TonB-dependent receptor domain-containing protein, partial [Usitatibacter sp.]
MKPLSLAGLAGIATLGAQAQTWPAPQLQQFNEPVVVTASRTITPVATLRDAVIITREEIEAAGPISLAELLQRAAGIELRSTGGPGQPQSLLIRGASAAETLVLVDGMRVGSATVGTTSIEHIPLELIERIEVVKGPLSSLYGAEAIGGVVQVFTRGKSVPHLFASLGYGTSNDRRASAGIVTEDNGLHLALSAGFRDVDAPSATNPRAFGYNPDRDPYRNMFANVRVSQKLWQGETVGVEAFGTRSRTHFDAGPGDDRNDQSISGARLFSSNQFTSWWSSRFTAGQGRDRIDVKGAYPGFLETRQDQAAWINELAMTAGKIIVGAETVRQRVSSDAGTPFSRTHCDTNSAFIGVNESYEGHRFEASARRDEEDQFGSRNTGSASYGLDLPGWGRLAATFARGFRPPTFYDLYGPSFPGAAPNPALQPERSDSTEYSLRSEAGAPV